MLSLSVLKSIVFFSSILCVGICANQLDLHNNRIKRSDIELQSCIDNFNIHKDKIIRTQDSQNMGAKYLNEIDSGSREECLRLCCETDNCDVFVFEEKNAGSCYLFHCGPPEDFKCKFTHHVNYSSGVLAINRHLPDLESQIKLTKHEQDLTKLRKPDIEPAETVVATETKTTSTPTSTSSRPKKILVPVSNDKTSEPASKCSRFQFECRSTKECIAIYNACDGIPQCADGSDEAAELKCPYTFTTALPLHNNIIPPPLSNRFQENLQPPKMSQPVLPQSIYRPAPLLPTQQESAPPLQVISNQEGGYLRPLSPIIDPKSYNNRPPIPYDEQQPFVPQIPIQTGQTNWIPRQQPPNQIPLQYMDKNSHIFNHKETGLQVPDEQDVSKIQYSENANGIRDYPKLPPNYYGENYRQPLQQQPENWPADYNYKMNTNNNNNNNNNNRIIEKIVQDQINSKAAQMQYKSIAVDATEPENPKHIQDKMAHDLKHSKDNMEHDQVTKIKIEKPRLVHYRQQYPDVVAYKISETNDLQDGVAQTPRGAVLSLTLGLIITCVMAILIGCRLKMVRRKMMRRGGKSYAHDADYLVNGMYL